MKLATARRADDTFAVRLEETSTPSTAIELDAADVGALVAAPNWRARAAEDGPRHAVADLDFGPVVTAPSKVLCVGHNYRDHIEEMGGSIPQYPTLFCKFADSLAGANDPIQLPPESTQVDWEAELCIVIGAEVRRATTREAIDAIAGFTVLNDVSMRDYQRHTSQFTAGKVWQHSTPVGPWMRTVDPPDDGSPTPRQRATPGWSIRTMVDGAVMQDSNTSQMVFDPVDLVEYASTMVVLRPGDLIATGTPGGVGAGRQPPVFLAPGQVVVTEIDGIGSCTNSTVAEPTQR